MKILLCIFSLLFFIHHHGAIAHRQTVSTTSPPPKLIGRGWARTTKTTTSLGVVQYPAQASYFIWDSSESAYASGTYSPPDCTGCFPGFWYTVCDSFQDCCFTPSGSQCQIYSYDKPSWDYSPNALQNATFAGEEAFQGEKVTKWNVSHCSSGGSPCQYWVTEHNGHVLRLKKFYRTGFTSVTDFDCIETDAKCIDSYLCPCPFGSCSDAKREGRKAVSWKAVPVTEGLGNSTCFKCQYYGGC